WLRGRGAAVCYDLFDVGAARRQRAEVDVKLARDCEATREAHALGIGAVGQVVAVVIDAVVADLGTHDRDAGDAAHAVGVGAVDQPVVVVVETVVTDLPSRDDAGTAAEAAG